MLLFFLIAIDSALGTTHAACVVVLGSVSGLGVDIGLWHWHDADILREVVLAGEVANVVPINSLVLGNHSSRLFGSYVDELGAGQGGDLTQDLNHASFIGRDGQPRELLLHFVCDTRRPAAHLIID